MLALLHHRAKLKCEEAKDPYMASSPTAGRSTSFFENGWMCFTIRAPCFF